MVTMDSDTQIKLLTTQIKLLASALLGGMIGGAVAYYACLSRKPRPVKRIILLRHGESEGNVDETIYQRKADNLLELTAEGSRQALAAGMRIAKLLGPNEKVDMYMSPFQRSLQTARNIRKVLNSRTSKHSASASASAESRVCPGVGEGPRSLPSSPASQSSFSPASPRASQTPDSPQVTVELEEMEKDVEDEMEDEMEARGVHVCCRHVNVESRIREQEFGNMQTEDFSKHRERQKNVGRFWYRFPTGESGADVYDRVKVWWDTQLMMHNKRNRMANVDTVIVVTHGLAMRCILMQLFGWSPDTFHTVWNAKNCDMYVLKYDPKKKGRMQYSLDPVEGDMPRSSKKLKVLFKDGTSKEVEIQNYLSIPQPRTCQKAFVKRMLEEQHGIHPATVADLDFHSQFRKFR